MTMSLSEALGYLASVLVFTTFYMKTMVVLLPMNCHRLLQARREAARSADSGDDTGARAPLMTHVSRLEVNRGEAVFSRGDSADSIDYLASGTIVLPEANVKVETGGTVGLKDLLSGRAIRSSSAVCETDCELYELSRAAISKLPDRERASRTGGAIMPRSDEKSRKKKKKRVGAPACFIPSSVQPNRAWMAPLSNGVRRRFH